MATLTIVAQITSKPDQVEFVRSELEKLVEPTRAEDGCIQYDLHQDNENPALFLFYENWENRDLWQQHINSPHIAAYRKATESAIEGIVLNEMTRIA